jgi:hypothetical protein
LKWIHLVLWTAVIFSICTSLAQIIDVSETPTQQSYEVGTNLAPQETLTPSQQVFDIGNPQTLQQTLTPSQETYESGANQTQPEAQTAIGTAPSGMPTITITSPREGATIPAGNVTVMVNVTGFNLVNMLGAANVAGEGHIHYYMDVPVPETPTKPAITSPGTYAPTANTSFTWMNVKPGMHSFSVQLVNNDHTPLIPLVYNTVNVTAA